LVVVLLVVLVDMLRSLRSFLGGFCSNGSLFFLRYSFSSELGGGAGAGVGEANSWTLRCGFGCGFTCGAGGYVKKLTKLSWRLLQQRQPFFLRFSFSFPPISHLLLLVAV